MRAILFAFCAILAVATARVVITAGEDTPHLLGAKACTWGPSYWCQNITTAVGCKATKHCIKNVWENLEVPEDHDTVCGICKDMVQQARDQLESNQTQEDLEAVFEGSCALIHIKPIVLECDKLVDQFIPELVETLASQMNPSVVCSVSGLCNSAHIDQLMLDYERLSKNDGKTKSLENDELEPYECSKCYTIATHMERMFSETSRDRLLEKMLIMCGKMSSFSDACSSIILSYFGTIYEHLQANFKADNICHLTGQCSAKFHKHEGDETEPVKVEIRPLSSVGMVEVSDDLPCKLCEQLVEHLKDLLVANTTEAEFKQVLRGLCKQTKSFSAECISIVDQYYAEIYYYLLNNLDNNAVCQMGSICPLPDKGVFNGPIWPLLPEKPAKIGLGIMSEGKKTVEKVNAKKTEADEMQLPVERMHLPLSGLAFPFVEVEGRQTCAFCEYLLHYVQQAITDPTTENEVKVVIEKVCKKLPESVQNECNQFIDTYGDAVVAILAQEIDPSQVCPMIHVCPSQEFMNAWEKVPKEWTIKSEVKDKPSCPLCLFAVTQLYNTVKDNKTEASIQAALDKLCIHLPKDLTQECVDLVNIYSKELVEMLLADLSPQEVCVYIKLCDPSKNVGPSYTFPTDKDGEIMTNEIPDFPLYPVQKAPRADDTKCVLCEFAMQYVDKAMSNKKTKEEIENIVHGMCHYLPKTVEKECNEFVNQYADVVIELLAGEISPKEVCTMIGLCKPDTKEIQESIEECALCQAVVSKIDKLLEDPKMDHNIDEVVSKICKFLPASKQGKCTMMMEIYEQSIVNLITSYGDTRKICSKLALCSSSDYFAMTVGNSRIRRSDVKTNNLGTKRCTWGPSYWCSTDENAAECKAVDHCKEHVWKAESAAAAKQQAKSA